MHARSQWPAIEFDEDTYGVVKRIEVFRQWLETCRNGRRLRVLDFGCGTGRWVTLPLAAAGDDVTGVDAHHPTIEAARRLAGSAPIRFATESANDLVHARQRYDIVIASEVLEHIHHPETVVDDFYRLLVPGGHLFVTVPNGYGPFENLRRIERVLRWLGIGHAIDGLAWLARILKWRLRSRPGWPPWPGSVGTSSCEGAGYLDFESGHVQFFRRRSFERMFQDRGFILEEVRGRTVLCGPYVDWVLPHLPGRDRWLRWNNELAERLPLEWTSDWMYRWRSSE